MLYPVSLATRRRLETPPIGKGGGIEGFDSKMALELNDARMRHLDSLGLELGGKTVLDIGCGIGHLTRFFVQRGCFVTCVDGREENISELKRRYAGVRAEVVDVESPRLCELGCFDIVFCYRLLYHLENPIAALRNMSAVCTELLLLETVVTDHELPVMQIVEETGAYNQALRGLANRPSPSFVVLALSCVGFPYVYGPCEPPNHEDFVFEWRNDGSYQRGGTALRCLFIASKIRLENQNIVELLRP